MILPNNDDAQCINCKNNLEKKGLKDNKTQSFIWHDIYMLWKHNITTKSIGMTNDQGNTIKPIQGTDIEDIVHITVAMPQNFAKNLENPLNWAD